MSLETPTPPASDVVSPKVIAQAVTSVALVVVIAVIGAVTPDLFDFLGDFAPLAYAGVVALGGALAGFFKNDPRRH